MTCIRCQHTVCVKAGSFGKRRIQRWKCTSCKSRFSEPHEKQTRNTFKSRPALAEQALKCLLEGCSIRSTERLTGLNRNTIMHLLIVAGERAAKLMDAKMRGLRLDYLQCDEIWTYCTKKQRRVRKGDSPEFGDQWVFVALDEQTKLIPHFEIGKRTRETTEHFLTGLRWKLTEDRFQITTDGYHFYRSIQSIFAGRTDFAQLVKLFGDYGQHDGPDARYSPPKITEVISKVIDGRPDEKHISTSFVERQNLHMRNAMKRFTRLTLGFSKKVSHLRAAIALHFAYYNFARVHSSLRVTPAMEAGLTDHVWSIAELLGAA
jgi:transposase-like protein/IS1 family transposase